jgi:transcriptional regulator MraZ
VLLGNSPAKIDEKGRLKVPTEFRTYIETTWGTSLFVTSDSDGGQSVQVYPMPVWLEIQKKLGAMPSSNPTRRKYALWTNYYGKVAELDTQGRVLIHPLLRDAAAMNGEVVVLGDYNRLALWNHDRFKQFGPDQKFTDDDWRVLSEHGI